MSHHFSRSKMIGSCFLSFNIFLRFSFPAIFNLHSYVYTHVYTLYFVLNAYIRHNLRVGSVCRCLYWPYCTFNVLRDTTSTIMLCTNVTLIGVLLSLEFTYTFCASSLWTRSAVFVLRFEAFVNHEIVSCRQECGYKTILEIF